MNITINGKAHEVAHGITIAELIDHLGLKPRGLAVERNLEVVSRQRHDSVFIEDGDQLEIVTLVGGG